MKNDKLKNYFDVFKSSEDYSGQVLDQLKLLRKFMTLKRLDDDMHLIIKDGLKVLEFSLRGVEWNKDIEKEWKEARGKLAKSYPQTDNGKVLPRYLPRYMESKIYQDYEYLLRMCLDIGIIERKASSKVPEVGD